MRIWTEAAKAAQREAIKRWQPWAKSTGPKTEAGKQRSAVNARKSERSSIQSLRILRAALTAQSRCRRAAHSYDLWENQKNSENRTIMMVYLRSVISTTNQTFLQGMLQWSRLFAEEAGVDTPAFTPEFKIAA